MKPTSPTPRFIVRNGERVYLEPKPVSVYRASDVGRHLRAARRVPSTGWAAAQVFNLNTRKGKQDASK